MEPSAFPAFSAGSAGSTILLPQQLRHLHFECLRQLLEGAERRVLAGRLKAGEVRATDARPFGELLLRHVASLSQSLHPDRHALPRSHLVPYRVQSVKM